jgi:L-asparaginase
MKPKKILILFCGGTIVMKRGADGSLRAPRPREAMSLLRTIEPRLDTVAPFDIEYIESIDSTNMMPDQWDRILRALQAHYRAYDGFVLTHGTDALAYTAAALSVAIRRLGKPVVLTGSQIPGAEVHTDARRNLVNAFKLACANVSGVFIVFDERILLGPRATKASESRMDAFATVNQADAGEIRLDIGLRPGLPRRAPGPLQIEPGFEPDVFVHTLTPGCDPGDLAFLLRNEKIKGIVIRAFGTGNFPDRFREFFRLAREKRVPVVVSSQRLHGRTLMGCYEVGLAAKRMGAIEGYDQSLESIVVKLMWALRRFPYEKIAAVMETPLGQELDKSYAV